ncbi:MAG TPA: ThuA domain-containing protein [Planctomycetota bacterium]|nr:ThuA domain-containing protein [Planctomycetota bacterium]
MMQHRVLLLCALLTLAMLNSFSNAADAPRKIVLIAGKKSHGPGAHDYERTMRLFKVMLDNSNVAERILVEEHENGWPEDPTTLESAHSVIFYSDGRDGDKYADVPFVLGTRMAFLDKQIQRGCGFMTLHFSTFVNDKEGEKVLDWNGGFFDWEGEPGKRQWYSKISAGKSVELATPEHPIARGVAKSIPLNDEVYWKIRFKENDKRLTPIWNVPGLSDGSNVPLLNTVAWALERADGGRGFGTSVGHSYRLWQDENVRRLILNAIVWTAGVEVPAGGVESTFYTDEQVEAALKNKKGAEKAIVPASKPAGDKGAENTRPLPVLLFAGNEAHKWHNWERTTPAIKTALEKDSRIQVDVRYNIEDLAREKLSEYSAILLNSYCNWQDGRGISAEAKSAFLKFLNDGGGLVVVHFANGAFHFSLPGAAASDWPEYRNIVRRVWNHAGQGNAKSAHDNFGKFKIELTALKHPITEGLGAFEVQDELYFNQDGSEPIEPLITAVSKITGKAEPLAWAYTYGKARVFQTLLGHSEKTYDSPEACEMLRRAVVWAGRENRNVESAQK